jgi:hypothetical protein
MYHYQPAVALKELEDDAVLPNPVHVRDMIIRARLSPDHALELNQTFQEYLHSFGETQTIGRRILEQLSTEPLKRQSASQ